MKRHGVLLAALVLVSLAGGLHDIFLLSKFDLPLSGTYVPFQQDEFHKMSEVKAAMEGHLLVGNPFLREEQDRPASNTPYGPALMALALRYTGLSLATASWLLDFLIPPFVLIMVFFLFRRLFPGEGAGPLAGLAFLFTLVFLMAPSQRGLMRFMSAQFTQPIFLALYIGGLMLYAERAGRAAFAALLIGNGAMPWLDPWFALILFGTHALAAVACRLEGRRATAAAFFGLLASASLGGVPEVLRLMAVSHEAGFSLLTARQGAFATFVPNYPDFLLWMAALGAILVAARTLGVFPVEKPLVRYAALTLGVCLALYLQNVVTGRRLYFQGEHVAAKALAPSGLLVIAVLRRLNERLGPGRGAALLVALAAAALLHHGVMVRKGIEWSTPPDRFDPVYGYDGLEAQKIYGSAFAWLAANAPETAVVLSDPAIDAVMRLAAGAYAYSSQCAVHVSRDQQGLIERYWPLLWARGTARAPTAPDPVWRTHELLSDYNVRDFAILYCSAGTALVHYVRVNRAVERLGFGPLFDAEAARRETQGHIETIYSGYEAYVAGREIRGLRDLLVHPCDYVLWGPQERHFHPAYDPSADPTVTKVFSDDARGVAVYRVL